MRVFEFLRLEGSMDGELFTNSSSLTKVFGDALRPAMRRASERTRDAVKARLPRATGRFQDSIQSRVASSGMRATVSERVRYGGAVDYGAQFDSPVPVPGLVEWVVAKGLAGGGGGQGRDSRGRFTKRADSDALGIAIAISRSKSGTKTQPRHDFAEGFDATLAANVSDFERALSVVVEGL